MAVMKKKGGKSLPPISTASLPDVIFMILFFFMISTTMRDQELLVRYKLPTATEVQKLEKKSLVSFIHIGQPTPIMQAKFGTAPRIQLNDSYRTEKDILDFIAAERDKLNESDRALMTVCLKALTPLRSRWDIKSPILYENDPMQLHRIVFYMPRSHPHHRSEELALSRPERLESRRDCSATRSGRMPAERRARPHPNSDRAHRPALRRWNPSLFRNRSRPAPPLLQKRPRSTSGRNNSVRIPTSIVCLSDSSKYDKIG